MYLVVAATWDEIAPLAHLTGETDQVGILVTGVGPVAAAVKLASYLSTGNSALAGVLNVGIGGAYPNSGLDLLDICIAGQETLGDLGVAMGAEILDFNPSRLPVTKQITMEGPFLSRVEKIFKNSAISYSIGNFITVNCSSGTEERGFYLQSKYQAICENMEGAAIAFTCKEFGLPCVEIRCISNLVEDRNPYSWQVDDAVNKLCGVTKAVLDQEYNR